MVKKKVNKKNNRKAKIIIDKTTYEFPIYNSTEGESVIDISKLHAEANVFTYCLLYTSPSPRDGLLSRMPSSA